MFEAFMFYILYCQSMAWTMCGYFFLNGTIIVLPILIKHVKKVIMI